MAASTLTIYRFKVASLDDRLDDLGRRARLGEKAEAAEGHSARAPAPARI
jgi:hypothetical protein